MGELPYVADIWVSWGRLAPLLTEDIEDIYDFGPLFMALVQKVDLRLSCLLHVGYLMLWQEAKLLLISSKL